MIDQFATVEKVKQVGNILTVDDDRIEPHLPAARLHVLGIIGKQNYDAIFMAEEVEPGEGVEFSKEDYGVVELAECYATLIYVTPELNKETTGQGITKMSGTGDGRKENLNENDINSIVKRYTDNVERFLKKYLRMVDTKDDDKTKNEICVTENIKLAAI